MIEYLIKISHKIIVYNPNQRQLMYRSSKNSLIFPTESSQLSQLSCSFQPKRCPRQCGKIVKNTNRTRTQSSSSSTILQQSYYGGRMSSSVRLKDHVYTQMRNQRELRWDKGRENKNQSFLENYQSKLAAYQTNKRSVLKDIERINNQQVEVKQPNTKSSHFFIQKLKQSLKSSLVLQPKIDKQNTSTLQISQKLVTETTKKLIKQLDQQIRLQNKLRQLKLQINPTNRKQIIEIIKKFYSTYQYDHESIMNISYQEYQFISKQGTEGKTISADILGEKLIQMYQICESNWKQNLWRRFNGAAVKEIFEMLNFENKNQLDFKYFTRELNLYFCRNYQPRELYRIFSRIAPLTKSNFVKIFAEPTKN